MKTLILLLVSLNIHAANIFPVVNPNVFYDKDGDAITILDTEARNKIHATKEISASHVYDNQEDLEKFKSQYEKKVLGEKKHKYGIYVVLPGDQLKKISQSLYGTTKRWNEIRLLNENILKNNSIQTGMKLRYLIDEKELKNDDKNRKVTEQKN